MLANDPRWMGGTVPSMGGTECHRWVAPILMLANDPRWMGGTECERVNASK
jgi:hypothetical protein